MKKAIILPVGIIFASTPVFAQSAIDAYRLSQPDMKGTARYMGMAGAFGALGGDLSAISENPGGIGVYRSSDIGLTLDIDMQKSNARSMGSSTDNSQTGVLFNNIGAVLTWRLDNSVCPNLNFGFTFNRGSTFNRIYGGNIPRLDNSLSNYVAGIANGQGLTEDDLTPDRYYDPYNPSYGVAPSWLAVLGYDGYLITPEVSNNKTFWTGQWGNNTSGSGSFAVEEKGSTSDFNIVFGGNISNILFWGMNFNIVNMNYTLNSIWSENLKNAYVPDNNNNVYQEDSNWSLDNYYHVNGTGFQYQIGVIIKPIQELRIGLTYHTPTWYNLTESFGATLGYNYSSPTLGTDMGSVSTNDGYLGYNNICFRTPSKFIASLAGVISDKLILSFDYELTPYSQMKYSEEGSYDYYPDYYPDYYSAKPSTKAFNSSSIFSNDPFYETNSDIKTYYKSTNTYRVGAEFRINPYLSVRAGYSNVSSPVKVGAANDKLDIYTAGTIPNYRFDNKTDYITAGLGFKIQHFYMDLAYVYKHMESTYHAYSPDTMSNIPSPQSKLSFDNNQIVISAGYRF